VDVIRGARREIALSLFRCNDDDVLEALADATARGVEVNVLVTSRVKGGPKKIKKLWKALEATGATIHAYTDPVVKYHAKYLVADDGPALIASLNFTRKCFAKTIDAIVVTYDPDVVSGLRSLLTADCGHDPMPTQLSPRLIVGPESARRQFTSIIAQASSSIRLIDRKASDPALMTLLQTRAAEGVRVELYDAKRLCGLRSHGKVMLVDDRLAVIGGLSLNPMSLDFRREVAITVTDSASVAEVSGLFSIVAASEAAKIPPPITEEDTAC